MGNLQGKVVDVGKTRVRVGEQIAEGGFAFVFHATEVHSGRPLALKRLVAQDRDSLALAKHEVETMRMLPKHKNLVQYVDSCTRRGENNAQEFLILMEFCDGGHLVDILFYQRNRRQFKYREMLEVFLQICEAVAVLHAQKPPITHRDLKVENVLLDRRSGKYKLCDFGSSIRPENREQILREEEEIQRYSTQMYRAPEMVDLYRKYLINEKVDIWALGCILYTIAFLKHPFEEGGSLQIINLKYKFPANTPYPRELNDLIRFMLVQNPEERPDIFAVAERVSQILGVPCPCKRPSHYRSAAPAPQRASPPQTQQPPERQQREQSTANPPNKLFGMLDWHSNDGGAAPRQPAPPSPERRAAPPSATPRQHTAKQEAQFEANFEANFDAAFESVGAVTGFGDIAAASAPQSASSDSAAAKGGSFFADFGTDDFSSAAASAAAAAPSSSAQRADLQRPSASPAASAHAPFPHAPSSGSLVDTATTSSAPAGPVRQVSFESTGTPPSARAVQHGAARGRTDRISLDEVALAGSHHAHDLRGDLLQLGGSPGVAAGPRPGHARSRSDGHALLSNLTTADKQELFGAPQFPGAHAQPNFAGYHSASVPTTPATGHNPAAFGYAASPAYYGQYPSTPGYAAPGTPMQGQYYGQATPYGSGCAQGMGGGGLQGSAAQQFAGGPGGASHVRSHSSPTVDHMLRPSVPGYHTPQPQSATAASGIAFFASDRSSDPGAAAMGAPTPAAVAPAHASPAPFSAMDDIFRSTPAPVPQPQRSSASSELLEALAGPAAPPGAAGGSTPGNPGLGRGQSLLDDDAPPADTTGVIASHRRTGSDNLLAAMRGQLGKFNI